jgi:GNAT superfamily N-acetyltransferase
VDRAGLGGAAGELLTKLVVRLVTPDLWPALEDLFGKAGASNGCWCMYWRMGPAYHERPRDRNRRALRAIVERGPPPGLLAFDGDRAVGWCQLTPRGSLPHLDRAVRGDSVPVWSVSCFFVRRGYRRQGVARALLAAAVAAARRAKAEALEAYPGDPRKTRNLYTGTLSLFAEAGFEVIEPLDARRTVVRRAFRRRASRGQSPTSRGRGGA